MQFFYVVFLTKQRQHTPRVDKIEKRWETIIHNRIKTKTTQAKSARMYKKAGKNKNPVD